MEPRKVIVTIAPTGGMASKKQSPNIPTQPREIAEDVHRCYNAGASIVAVHARRPDDQATCNADIYRQINELIRAKCDIIINNSTGGGINGDMVRQAPNGYFEIIYEERLKGMEAGAEMCTLDPTTIIATFEGREILMNTSPQRCRELAEKMKAKGIKPEWEVFSPTHLLQDVSACLRAGLDEPPYFINFVLGCDRGFQGAMPYSPKILQQMVELMPQGAIFNVSAVGPAQLDAGIQSLLLGGHVRVGLEDNLYYSRGRLATNVEQVERIVRIIRDMGLEPATAAEARAIIGLPRRASASVAA
jgi:3-keto-5-aminohexanoate cleavage enzyme